ANSAHHLVDHAGRPTVVLGTVQTDRTRNSLDLLVTAFSVPPPKKKRTSPPGKSFRQGSAISPNKIYSQNDAIARASHTGTDFYLSHVPELPAGIMQFQNS